MARFFLGCYQKVAVVSSEAAHDMARWGLPVPKVIYPPFAPEVIPSQCGRGPRLLYMGRLVSKKGLKMLVKAVSNMPEVHLDIAGDGALAFALRQMAGSNISFHGYVSGEKKRQLLKRNSILVLPSEGEGCPVSVLEAMASGLLIVGTPTGEMPTLLQKQQIMEGYDGAAFERCLERVLNLGEGVRAQNRRVAEAAHPQKVWNTLNHWMNC